MKKSLKPIFVLVIILLVLLFTVIVAIITNRTKEQNNNQDTNSSNDSLVNENKNGIDNSVITEDEEATEVNFSETPFCVTNAAYFYTVEDCINEYINGIKKLQKEDTEENRKNVYNKLSSSYTSENNITLDNVSNIGIKEGSYFAGIIRMFQLNVSNNYVMRYAARTMFLDNDDKVHYFDFIVYLDYANLSFAVEPISENNDDLSKVNLKKKIENIDENDYNKYSYKVIAKNDLASKYVSFFKALCYQAPEIAYNYLSEDYKESVTLERFKNTISNNPDSIKYMHVMSCDSMTEDNGETKYICTNVGGGYITIYEKNIMNFKISLSV